MNLTDKSLDGPFAIIHNMETATVFVFPIAPQQIKVSLPARGAVRQTLSDNFLDDFSGRRAVLADISLRGTFGYHPKFGGIGRNAFGSSHLKTLELIYERYNALSRQVKRDMGATQQFQSLSRLYFWRVWIKDLQITQDSNSPLLWDYSISMVRLEDLLSPAGPPAPIPNPTPLAGLF